MSTDAASERDVTAVPRTRIRREDPEVRRQELLRATVTCLARLGPNGTSGREICRQAGVSHSLLRHYFGNPQTLLLEAYEQLSEQFIARLEADVLVAQDDPWRALDRLFALHLSEDWAGPDVLGAWIGFWTLVRARAEFAMVRDNFNRRLGLLIDRLLRRLAVPGDELDIEDATAIIAGVMDGLWLDFGLASPSMTRERALALCRTTARRVVGAQAPRKVSGAART